MIPDRGLVSAKRIGSNVLYRPLTRQMAEKAIVELRGDSLELWELIPAPSCACCGEEGMQGHNRCFKHRGRTPCSIDGCARSRKFEHYVGDGGSWVCSVHWKLVCPPRSPLRRTYLRFYRTARRQGVEKDRWPDDLEARYWRFMAGVIRRYNRRLAGEGFIDEAEINRMFGWDCDAG